MTDGGWSVPESFVDKVLLSFDAANPMLDRRPRPPLTRKQRIRARFNAIRWGVWWGLHDRMFGRHEYDD